MIISKHTVFILMALSLGILYSTLDWDAHSMGIEFEETCSPTKISHKNYDIEAQKIFVEDQSHYKQCIFENKYNEVRQQYRLSAKGFIACWVTLAGIIIFDQFYFHHLGNAT